MNALTVARAAFANFRAGLAGDDEALGRFIDEMHDEVVLYFPTTPNLGGAYRGKDRVRELFAYVRKAFSQGLFITIDREFVSDDTVAFQFHDEAPQAEGRVYRGTIVITLTIKDGRVWRYREYFGARWSEDVEPND